MAFTLKQLVLPRTRITRVNGAKVLIVSGGELEVVISDPGHFEALYKVMCIGCLTEGPLSLDNYASVLAKFETAEFEIRWYPSFFEISLVNDEHGYVTQVFHPQLVYFKKIIEKDGKKLGYKHVVNRVHAEVKAENAS